ncbi:hypothetical protein QL285_043708 [Trifolium repens]|nr:hypothetical protein QL285_043708 [Trifolium repens]
MARKDGGTSNMKNHALKCSEEGGDVSSYHHWAKKSIGKISLRLPSPLVKSKCPMSCYSKSLPMNRVSVVIL